MKSKRKSKIIKKADKMRRKEMRREIAKSIKWGTRDLKAIAEKESK